MSGHSHWAGIKHRKGIEDAKRAKIFTKLARLIVVAAREKGGDPNMNASLRMVIEKARAANMPADKIERAIKRATGEDAEMVLHSFLYEAFAPGGAAVLVEGITDNTNRSLNEVRKIITSHDGRMAEQGSVQWMFDRKGHISIKEKADAERELAIIDAGADDIKVHDEGTDIYTAPDKLMEVKNKLEAAGFTVGEAGFAFLPKNPVAVESEEARKKLETFFEALDDHDDVQDIFSNTL